jgi:hypothetical protein
MPSERRGILSPIMLMIRVNLVAAKDGPPAPGFGKKMNERDRPSCSMAPTALRAGGSRPQYIPISVASFDHRAGWAGWNEIREDGSVRLGLMATNIYG